jgi:hypothetical protein
MNNGSQRMVGWKRVQFGVKSYVWCVDPDASAGPVRDIHIYMHLCDGNSQRRSAIDNGMFTEEDNLARGRSKGHDR